MCSRIRDQYDEHAVCLVVEGRVLDRKCSGVFTTGPVHEPMARKYVVKPYTTTYRALARVLKVRFTLRANAPTCSVHSSMIFKIGCATRGGVCT